MQKEKTTGGTPTPHEEVENNLRPKMATNQ
jgi:hypothetical protein